MVHNYASGQVDEILATIRHDITSVETNLEAVCRS